MQDIKTNREKIINSIENGNSVSLNLILSSLKLTNKQDSAEIKEFLANAELFMSGNLYSTRDFHINGVHKQENVHIVDIDQFEEEFLTKNIIDILETN
jgi:hypothetical protein